MDFDTPQLVDTFDRRINYLRISVTDRCNLRCIYCMPRKGLPKLNHAEILTYEEILRITKVAVGLGINKVRVTGGEPLARKGILTFLEELSSVREIEDISLTTNGVMVADRLQALWDMGIRRINISLDTLSRKRYQEITSTDAFYKVWHAIEKAHELGFSPIKINMVVIGGVNEDEILDFARLTLNHPYQVRFIEYMPIGPIDFNTPSRFISTKIIKQTVESLGPLIPVKSDCFDGPAQRYKLEGATGELGFISPISDHFCGKCNRLRLTADGKLRVCLLSDLALDLKTPIRSGISDRELAQLIVKAVLLKPSGHQVERDASLIPSGQMSSIGG